MSLEVQAIFGHPVQPSPNKMIESHDEYTHHADTQCDSRKVTDRCFFRDITADAVSLYCGGAPGHVFGNDTGVPRAAGSGNGTRHETGKDGRKQIAPPLEPAAQAKVLRRKAQFRVLWKRRR